MPPPPPPHKAIATNIIQKCAATTSLREACQLHALLVTSPIPTEPPLFVHNNILSMYARCGSLMDSHLLFDKMPHRNIVSYNTLISAYSRTPNHTHMAFLLFDRLETEGHVPNGSTVTSLLQASAGLGDVAVGSALHAQCVKIGLLDNVRIQTSLLGMYSTCGNVDYAKKVFFQMMIKDTIAWNSILTGFMKNGKVLESLQLFQCMLKDGVNPCQFTYSMVLSACAKLQDYDNGKFFHAQVLLSGTYIDLPLQNSLLVMYCSCGDTRTAFDVFLRIQNPDLVSWNSMIGGYSDNGDGAKAMEMFVQLTRVSPLKPDEYTLAAVISGTSGFPACEYGKPLHAQAEKTGLMKSLYVGSTLLTMYLNNDDSESSQKIFSSFLRKDVVLWTDMIAGHVRIGESEAALNFFHAMHKEGLHLDSFALSSVLAACADLVTLRQGEMIHCLALKTGNDAEVCVHSSLVDMYAKNGELSAAAYTFSCMPKCDLMCWNSMLTGYSHHGKANEAFQIFFKMLKHGLNPDHVTFLSLITACNHCGLVEKSRYFWKSMKEHRLRPGPKHYSCMISVLSRAGLWEEAEEMILASPSENEYSESWRTVLSSCIENGNLREGIRAGERILSIGLEDSAANVLLAKLFAAVGRWDNVSETRRKMRKLILEKDHPGLSWTEVGNGFHVFSSGEQMQDGEIQVEVCRLLANLMPSVEEEIIM